MSSTIGRKMVNRLRGFAESLGRGDDITERFTCRTIKLNLVPRPYNSVLVKDARSKLGASQAIFSQFLGVSIKALQDWEQGRVAPTGAVCRLMDDIRRNPRYWIKRLMEFASPVAKPLKP